MPDNPPIDNHLRLAQALASPLAQDIKVGTALALVERGANIFKIDKNKVAFWMETAAAQGQWRLVDFFVSQLSNLTVVRSSSGAPTSVVANALKPSHPVSSKCCHPTACGRDDTLLSQVGSSKLSRV